MRILRRSGFRAMPWKNGGGETTEIAIAPRGAGLDDFDWRVSMARVAVDGPFSVFPGIDRSLTLLEGEGMTLAIEGRDPVHLTVRSPPLAFPGEAPAQSRLTDEPVIDLNVMTRRGVWRAEVERPDARQPVLLDGASGVLLLLCRGGGEAGDERLLPGDVAMLDDGAARLHVRCDPGAMPILIRIVRVPPA